MIDQFALVLSHLLLAIAGMRLLMRADLDDEGAGESAAAGCEEPSGGA